MSPMNPMTCHVQMANVRMASLWCRGKRTNPLLGTHLSSALWQTYVSGSAREAGTAAKTAAQHKEAKYATLQGTHLFQPVVVESMGTVEEATSSFLIELGPVSYTHLTLPTNREV